jgi:hypothetical protein
MANPDTIKPGTPLYIVRTRERGDDEPWETVLYTCDADLRDQTVRAILPDYPQRKPWEPHVHVDEAALDQPR